MPKVEIQIMTPTLIRQWIASLAPTPEQRLKVLSDLLDNADEDEMSDEDRTICLQQYAILLEQENLKSSKG